MHGTGTKLVHLPSGREQAPPRQRPWTPTSTALHVGERAGAGRSFLLS